MFIEYSTSQYKHVYKNLFIKKLIKINFGKKQLVFLYLQKYTKEI